MNSITTYLLANRTQEEIEHDQYDYRTRHPIAPRIVCRDGFSLSVQANYGAYCSPRDNAGPWTLVEVGFPSAVPEIILAHADNPESPTETVYGYVPVRLIEQLIDLHGGSEQLEVK